MQTIAYMGRWKPRQQKIEIALHHIARLIIHSSVKKFQEPDERNRTMISIVYFFQERKLFLPSRLFSFSWWRLPTAAIRSSILYFERPILLDTTLRKPGSSICQIFHVCSSVHMQNIPSITSPITIVMQHHRMCFLYCTAWAVITAAEWNQLRQGGNMVRQKRTLISTISVIEAVLHDRLRYVLPSVI